MPATPEECRQYRKRLRRRVRRLLGHQCVVCQSTKRIEYAHIKPTTVRGVGRGLARRYRDILINHTSYIPMCHSCHVGFDAHQFDFTVHYTLWGLYAIVYNPPRGPGYRRKRRRSNTDSKTIKRTGDCPF